MADWDEIKRLAADFQRTQTSDTLQRISERNCIDIIKKLTELNLIELIYTCDGKEFITPVHLLKEIKDEIYINGGRMHLHDLAANLNVDYQHVDTAAKDLARDNPDEYSLILGQVIHSTYKTTLSKQINDCMLVHGQLSIADFAKSLDLPSEFLLTIVKELMPMIMDDFVISQDGRTYYTADMMDRYRSIIAGALSAISRPTSIASLMKRLDIPERIFAPIIESLIKDGRIDAAIENRLFIPAVYAREQNEWINKFYESNSYIAYDVLSRMDIKQPKIFLKKRFPTGFQLKTCFVSPGLISQVESLIEDCIMSNGWLDICTIVPTAIEPEDIELLLQDIFKKNKQFNTSCLIFDRTHVCSLGFIATCKTSLSNLMRPKAQEELKQGKLINHFLGGPVKPRKSKLSESQDKDKENPKSEEKKSEQETVAVQETPASQNPDEEPQNPPAKDVKKDKKVKVQVVDSEESDEDKGGKKSKSRKGGGGSQGGSQGREMKQRSTKKKYFPGNKGNQRGNESDEESAPSKAPRSNKGRAARRGMSPERPSMEAKAKNSQQAPEPTRKEPLVFMTTEDIVGKLRIESRGSGECSDEFLEALAALMENDLNASYQTLARDILDEYLKSQTEEEHDPSKSDDIELVD